MPDDERDTGAENSEDDAERSPITAGDRLAQKHLAAVLRLYAHRVAHRGEAVPVCDEQAALIEKAAAQLVDAAEATWPGEEMPSLAEIRQGDLNDDDAQGTNEEE